MKNGVYSFFVQIIHRGVKKYDEMIKFQCTALKKINNFSKFTLTNGKTCVILTM